MSSLQIVFSTLVILPVVLFGIYIQRERRRLINQVDKFTPIPWRLIPGLLSLNFDNVVDFVRSLADFMPMRGWFSPLQMIVTVTDPEDVQTVLSDPKVAEKAYMYKFFNSDHGLLASQHHIWKVHRKILNPAFAISNIRSNMVPVFREKSDLMLQRMRFIEDGVDCDLVNNIKFCLVETSLATFAGEQFDKEEIEEYSRCMTTRIESVARRFLNMLFHWDIFYRLTNHYRVEQKCVKSMENLISKIITNHRERWPGGQSDRKLIVDLLMNRLREKKISEREVIEELDTIIFTSVDTSTHLINFIFLVIAMKPQLQEELVAELKSVFYSPEVPFDFDQLKKLEQMDRVIKETVRIYPIVPFLIKVAKAPIQLSNSTIPEGVLALVPIMSIHESPKVWGPDAKVFNPDNFLPENIRTRHPYSFIPFAAGRNCIGFVYAKFIIHSIIARILMAYRLESSVRCDEDIQLEYKITLNLKNPNPLRLYRRTDFYSDPS